MRRVLRQRGQLGGAYEFREYVRRMGFPDTRKSYEENVMMAEGIVQSQPARRIAMEDLMEVLDEAFNRTY